MPFERRLHPATLLFDLVRHVKQFAFPAVLLMLGVSRTDPYDVSRFVPFATSGWETWLLVLLVPAAIASIARYVSFRLLLDDRELVVRSGIFFRRQRHIPFSRIQNIDATENLLQRLFGVIEVRVETAGGSEEEARLRVLPRAALDEIRHRVFAGRALPAPAGPAGEGPAAAASSATRLVHLAPRELLLFGILDNRGLILLGALLGGVWETGIVHRLAGWAFGGDSFGRGVVRALAAAVFDDGPMPWGDMAVAGAAIVALLAVAGVVSMLWAFSRLYDFRLTRVGEDLRTDYGLLTRVTTTVPMRRVQTLVITEGPIHRLLARSSVRVETAGGGGAGEAGPSVAPAREWLAPIIGRGDLPRLLGEVLPGFDLDAVTWQPVHPRAFRRAVKPGLAFSGLVALAIAIASPLAGIVLSVPLAAWSVISSRKHVEHLAWAEADDVVIMRSGWLWRQVTLARVNKIQAVALHESPFDRRNAMAAVKVDTAGADQFSQRIDIPYLERATAAALASRLSTAAASTAFRW